MKSLNVVSVVVMMCAVATEAFPLLHASSRASSWIAMVDSNEDKPKNFFDGLKGMFDNFDDVVDDFLFKRMGAGEQWYGQRKNSPSGKFDGKYSGMGKTDSMRIEIAQIQKEEMEKRKQRRLAAEEEKRNNRN
jgi:hypothetical protein